MTVVRLAVIQVADTGSFMTAVPLWCHSSVPMMSSQCLTLGSRNFIKLVSIKVAVLC
ncbi:MULTISPECIES: hypothetical protein [Wolbachia]|uniref:hypothetical protein n=1 Tax=Wolbachia TaxID=953 RepID=UPI000A65447B|nr:MULTISPECIES: hypothetical protein [Wolbachia]MBA8756142.1 hypothetical protein [Wolbachia pipientis]